MKFQQAKSGSNVTLIQMYGRSRPLCVRLRYHIYYIRIGRRSNFVILLVGEIYIATRRKSAMILLSALIVLSGVFLDCCRRGGHDWRGFSKSTRRTNEQVFRMRIFP